MTQASWDTKHAPGNKLAWIHMTKATEGFCDKASRFRRSPEVIEACRRETIKALEAYMPTLDGDNLRRCRVTLMFLRGQIKTVPLSLRA